jgi:DnaJ-class molecular chaperone
MSQTHYQVLGVPEDASAELMKKAFRELAMRHHPDRNPGNPAAEATFKRIAAAYEVLGGADRRAAYDRQLAIDRAASAAARAESTRRANAAASSTNWGAIAFVATLFGVGVGVAAVAVASSSSASAPRWDRRVGRYRDPDGKFTPG